MQIEMRGDREGRKQFFFEKKNQKTFTNLGPLFPERPKLNNQKFSLLSRTLLVVRLSEAS